MERWYWPFFTPNVAGVMYAAGAVLLIGVLGWMRAIRAHKRAAHRWLTVLVVMLALMVIGIEAATGSRAGWVAMIGGIATLVAARIVSWRIALAMIGCLFAAIVVWPVAHPRLVQDPTTDSSITIRLQVWRATLALIHDHLWTGVGIESFAPMMDRWYLPSDLQRRYSTALNDGLTLAGVGGLPLLGLVGAGIGALGAGVCAGGRGYARAGGIRWISLAVLVVVLIGGQFQGHLWAWWSIRLLAMMALITALIGVIIERRSADQVTSSRIGQFVLGAICGAALPMVLVLALGAWYQRTRPVQTESMNGGLLVRPMNQPIHHVAWLAISSEKTIDHLLKSWAEPLLNHGWALVLPAGDFWQPSAITQSEASTTVVLAWGDAAQEIVRKQQNWPIILIDPEGDPPALPADDAVHHIDHPNVLIFAARFAPFVNTEAWTNWANPGYIHITRDQKTTAVTTLPLIQAWLEKKP